MIDGAEPVAQRLELMRVADRIDNVLQLLGTKRVLAGKLRSEVRPSTWGWGRRHDVATAEVPDQV